jgi:hypothetical protein
MIRFLLEVVLLVSVRAISHLESLLRWGRQEVSLCFRPNYKHPIGDSATFYRPEGVFLVLCKGIDLRRFKMMQTSRLIRCQVN